MLVKIVALPILHCSMVIGLGFFSDLQKFISKHWQCFQHVLGPDKNEIINYLKVINKLRIDAHAKDITAEDMQYFRVSANKVERFIKDFFG